MDITEISRETIKPSSPTPDHLRHLNISLIDQYYPSTMYTTLVLFYSAPQGDANRFQDTNMSHRLKTSLSEVLTEFYPLAGKVVANRSIECDDTGLEYVEARVKAPLTLNQFLITRPKGDELDVLLPYEFKTLSAVQVTVFDACGSMAIGVRLSHVLADASSAAVFIHSWAAIARGASIVSPTFNFASLFPPRADMPEMFTSENIKVARKCITKSFFFTQLKIETLRSKLAYERPTRVEALSALLLKCLIKATHKSRASKSIYMMAPINLRSRMRPPLPMHSFGNMLLYTKKQICPEITFEDLAVQFRNTIREVDSDYVGKLQADDASLLSEMYDQCMKVFMTNDFQFFNMDSWCKFPFYETDVGWGAPTWVAPVFHDNPGIVGLLDAKNGDGIEAWVTLDADEMAQFESNHEFLEYACATPELGESQSQKP